MDLAFPEVKKHYYFAIIIKARRHTKKKKRINMLSSIISETVLSFVISGGKSCRDVILQKKQTKLTSLMPSDYRQIKWLL